VDYVNGGPAFRLLCGAALGPALQAAAEQRREQQQQRSGQPPPQRQGEKQQAQQLAGVELLAVYPEHDDAAAALLCRVGSRGGCAVLCGTHPELHPSWLSGRAPTSADASRSSSEDSSSSEGSGSDDGAVRRLGVQAAAGAAQAGTRSFVDTAENRAAAASTLAAQLSGEGHVQRLQAALHAGRAPRQRFWRSLLVAAGLRPWMRPAETV
jgi:biotin--protein ligase